MDLENLKYSELQKLAKSAGIRANMKVEKLVKALKDHYSNQRHGNIEKTDGINVDQSKNSSSEEDQNSAETDVEKEDQGKKKAPARGRKKAQKKGTRGKTKKNSSSDESKEETPKTQTPENKTRITKINNTSFTKQAPTKTPQQNTPTIQQVSKKTPKDGTLGIRKTPTSVKPVSARTPQRGTPGVKKTPVIVKPVSAKTLQAGSKKTPCNGARPAPAVVTPGLLSTKTPKSSTAAKKQKTAVSGGIKRSSPRNHAEENGQANNAEISDPAVQAKTSGQKRKRKSTFELDGPTLGAPATPEVEQTDKKAKTSPGVQAMLDSMSGELSSAERRKRLMSAIDKKVEKKVKKSPHPGPTTQIPRFAAFLAQRKQEQKKPVTPGNKDWEKVHKKEFSKFDSIDVYLEKKRKRAEEMTASVKKARTVLHEVQEAVTKLKSKRTPSLGKKNATQPFKPSVISTKNMNLNFGATSSTKTPSDKKSTATSKPFKPSVTSTKDMNLNFSSLKTPVNGNVRKQRTPTSSKTSGAPSGRKSTTAGQMSARKSLGASAARKSFSTPFHFTGNQTMSDVSSTSKPVFDLKASLARPLTWKMHTGKLKPMESYSSQAKKVENSASKPASGRMDVFKSAVNRTRMTYSRQDRRAATAAKRAEQKSSLQMKRRGISVAP